MWYVYILHSEKLQRYYVGSTIDAQKRLRQHNHGKSNFTRKGIPWELVLIEELRDRSAAYRREMEIKRYKGGIQFDKLVRGNYGGVA